MSDRIPRLAMADLPPALAEALRPRVERLGYLGEFFACAGHQPAALSGFVDFTESLKDALPPRTTELVALSVAGELGNDYERHQHERLSLKLGFSEDWIRSVTALEEGGIVQRTVLDLLRDHGRSADVDALAAEQGDAFAVAVLLLTGRYLMHSTVVNALGLAPPVPSPLKP